MEEVRHRAPLARRLARRLHLVPRRQRRRVVHAPRLGQRHPKAVLVRQAVALPAHKGTQLLELVVVERDGLRPRGRAGAAAGARGVHRRLQPKDQQHCRGDGRGGHPAPLEDEIVAQLDVAEPQVVQQRRGEEQADGGGEAVAEGDGVPAREAGARSVPERERVLQDKVAAERQRGRGDDVAAGVGLHDAGGEEGEEAAHGTRENHRSWPKWETRRRLGVRSGRQPTVRDSRSWHQMGLAAADVPFGVQVCLCLYQWPVFVSVMAEAAMIEMARCLVLSPVLMNCARKLLRRS